MDGYPPQDIDVLVVGTADFFEVANASHYASNKLQIDVNPKIVPHTWWEEKSGSGLREEIERRPIVEIEVRSAKQSTGKVTGARKSRV